MNRGTETSPRFGCRLWKNYLPCCPSDKTHSIHPALKKSCYVQLENSHLLHLFYKNKMFAIWSYCCDGGLHLLTFLALLFVSPAGSQQSSACSRCPAWPLTGRRRSCSPPGRQPWARGRRCCLSSSRPTRWMRAPTSGFTWNRSRWKSSTTQ